jgi:hypothetical protein
MNLVIYPIFIACLVLAIKADILNASGQQTAISEHNLYRSELAKGNVTAKSGKLPPASNMNQVIYGKTLETEAQNWAKTCPGMKHTPNAKYGQNLYWTSQNVDQATALKQATECLHFTTLWKLSDNI